MIKIRNETSSSADLYISGTIIDDEEADWMKFWIDGDFDGYQFPAALRRQLDGVKGKDLNIYINSYGGSVPAGLAMAHMIERHKGKTTAIVEGYCCSIASLIFFSSDVCKMYSNSYLMIHKPFSGLIGNANELRKAAEILDSIQSGFESKYMEKANSEVKNDDIHKMVESETWLTGTEAAEKFKIEVLTGSKLSNCFGSVEKLKAIGAKKIPTAINFSPEESKAEWQEVEKVFSRLKGLI